MKRISTLLMLLLPLLLLTTVISAHHESSATPIEVGESYEFSVEEVSRLKIQLELGQMVFLRVESKVDLQGLFSMLYYVFPEYFSATDESDDHTYYRLGADGAEDDTYLIDILIPPNCCEDPTFALDVIPAEAITTTVGEMITIAADAPSPQMFLLDLTETPYIQVMADVDRTPLRLEYADGLGLNRHGDDLSGHLSQLNEHDAYLPNAAEAPIRLMVFAPERAAVFEQDTQITIQAGQISERSIELGETIDFTAENEVTIFTVAAEPYEPLRIHYEAENPAWLFYGEQRTGHNNSGSLSGSLEVVPTSQSGEIQFSVSDELRYGATGDFTITVEAIEPIVIDDEPRTVEIGDTVIAADLDRDQSYRLSIDIPEEAQENVVITTFGASYPRIPSFSATDNTREFVATRDGRAFIDITYDSDETIPITISLVPVEG